MFHPLTVRFIHKGNRRQTGYIRTGSEDRGHTNSSNVFFFADDIVLIAKDGKDLRLLLDVAAQGVKERRLNFNAAKSKVIVSWREHA